MTDLKIAVNFVELHGKPSAADIASINAIAHTLDAAFILKWGRRVPIHDSDFMRKRFNHLTDENVDLLRAKFHERANLIIKEYRLTNLTDAELLAKISGTPNGHQHFIWCRPYSISDKVQQAMSFTDHAIAGTVAVKARISAKNNIPHQMRKQGLNDGDRWWFLPSDSKVIIAAHAFQKQNPDLFAFAQDFYSHMKRDYSKAVPFLDLADDDERMAFLMSQPTAKHEFYVELWNVMKGEEAGNISLKPKRKRQPKLKHTDVYAAKAVS